MAVLVVAAAFLLRQLMVQGLDLELPTYITFYPAIMIAAILAGLGPGLLATALVVLGTDYVLLPPFGHFAVARGSDAFALAFFAAMGVFISLLAERYRRSQRSISAYELERARRLDEDRVRQASEFKQLALDAAELGTWEFRPESGGVTVDANCRRLFGFQPDDVDAQAVLVQRIHPEDAPNVDAAVMTALTGANNGLWGTEHRVIWPDGSVHWLKSHGRAFFDGEGESRRAVCLIGLSMNITERKRAEEELRKSELFYRGLFNSMDEGFCIIQMIFDPEGKPADYLFLETNAAFERQTGLHDAAGKRMRELAPSIEGHWFETYGKVAVTGEPVHFFNESAALGRYFEASAYQVGEPEQHHVAVVFSDITARVQADTHIRRLSRTYSVLSDINQCIVREKDTQAMLEAACKIAVEKGQFRMAWVGMVNPETHVLEPVAWSGVVDGYLEQVRVDLRNPNIVGPAERAFHNGEHSICNDIEHELFRPWREDAVRHGYRSLAAFPLSTAGEIVGVFCLYAGELGFFDAEELKLLDEMAMDISFALEVNRGEVERRKAEERLRWRTAFFEAQVESALDGVLVIDGQGWKILQNQRLNELFKIPRHVYENPDDEVQRKFVAALVKDPSEFDEKIQYLQSHPEEVSRDEIELLDGTILDRYSAPVRDKSGNYYGRIWTFHDITEQRQLESNFRQAQKMEAIGQLTGGIAHDFNNLLTVIMGCSEVLGEEVKENPRLGKMAEMMLGAAQRGAELTHRMLAFARRQTLEPRAVNVNDLLMDMETFLRRTLSADVALDVIQGCVDCEATVDPTQLESAILNLCVNARDAMPGGGTLTIETCNSVLDANYAAQNPEVVPGDYLLVAVSDTGTGITAENLGRVFDPFFTTKGVGKGTGLGLSMVYGFVKQSKGHIKIYSEPGHGTSVKIYLPRADQKSEPSQQSPAPIGELRGSETILLADDNAHVREFAKTQLEYLGYRVFEAGNGTDALQVLRDEAKIDLLFTDVVMPGGMNGRELATEACKLAPGLKVLFTSGYAENAIAHQGLLDKDVLLLNKPYTRLELAGKIRSVLDKV